MVGIQNVFHNPQCRLKANVVPIKHGKTWSAEESKSIPDWYATKFGKGTLRCDAPALSPSYVLVVFRTAQTMRMRHVPDVLRLDASHTRVLVMSVYQAVVGSYVVQMTVASFATNCFDL